MLPEPLRLLISAYAAGDLSPGRRQAAERLLRHSADARQLLHELKVNRRRLRTLPKPKLPDGFADRVLKAIPEQPPIIQPLVRTPGRDRERRTRQIAAVLAVVLVAGVGSWLIVTASDGAAVRSRTVASKSGSTDDPTATARLADPEPVPIEAEPPTDRPDETAVVTQTPPASPDLGPTPSVPPKEPLGNVPLAKPELVRVVPPRLLTLPVRGVDADGRRRLQQEFGKAETHHVDLFCHDTSRAFERLQSALRGRGVRLVVDAVAQETVKRKLRAHYLVYCDDLTAAEWDQLLQQVGVADRKAEEKKAGDGVFDHVVVLPLEPADQKDLAGMLGVDPLTTANRQRPDAEGRKGGKVAIALPQPPWRTDPRAGASPASKEVRQFLEAHKGRIPGTIAVVLLIRLPVG